MFQFRKIKAILFINVASKLVGFFREAYISYLFGISPITDTYFAVQQIPTIVSNYMFGAFSLVFIPRYVQLQYKKYSKLFLRNILKGLIGVGAVIMLLMLENKIGIFPRMLGINPETLPLAVQYLRLLSLSILPVIITAVSYSILHARQEHVRGMLLSALAPFIMVISMATLSMFPESKKTFILPLSFVAGSLIASVMAFSLLRKEYIEKNIMERPNKSNMPNYSFIKQLCASSIENVGANINQLINVYFAATIGSGSVAINAYALRIAMLPLSGIVSPANQMIHTSLSKDNANGVRIRFSPLAVKLVIVWIAIALVIVLLREPLVMLVYQRGAFSQSDVVKVANMLIPYSFYFVVMATNQVYARYFFSTSQGGHYSTCLILGYLVGNILKPFLVTEAGLSGIIWACVIGEGMVSIYFTLKMAYVEIYCYE